MLSLVILPLLGNLSQLKMWEEVRDEDSRKGCCSPGAPIQIVSMYISSCTEPSVNTDQDAMPILNCLRYSLYSCRQKRIPIKGPPDAEAPKC